MDDPHATAEQPATSPRPPLACSPRLVIELVPDIRGRYLRHSKTLNAAEEPYQS